MTATTPGMVASVEAISLTASVYPPRRRGSPPFLAGTNRYEHLSIGPSSSSTYDGSMAYIDVNGHPTWLTVGESAGPTVLLLHGGLSNGDAMLDTIRRAAVRAFRLAAFDRRGHGRTADTDDPFHYDAMVDETVAVIDHIGGPVHIVGWSDGGIIGLLFRVASPGAARSARGDRCELPHAGMRDAEMDMGNDDPAFVMIAGSYAERSPDGAEHFEVVASKSFAMFSAEPTLTVDDLAQITAPTLVMVGDDDLIEPSHTVRDVRRDPQRAAVDRPRRLTRTSARARRDDGAHHQRVPDR